MWSIGLRNLVKQWCVEEIPPGLNLVDHKSLCEKSVAWGNITRINRHLLPERNLVRAQEEMSPGPNFNGSNLRRNYC